MAHPWTNQREARYHIWTQDPHDFSPRTGPSQPKHRWDSIQKEGGIAVEGATAPKSLFPALTTLSSNCTFPTAWSTYLIVLLPQTQSFREKNSFSHLIGGSFFCISRLFQWQFHPSTHHRGCDPQNHFRCPLSLDFLIQLVPRAAESSSS